MQTSALVTALLATSLSTATLAKENLPIASHDAQLAADEAFVLVDMGARGPLRHYVSSLKFSGKKADIALSVPRGNGIQLVKVKAGTYQPDSFSIGRNQARNAGLGISKEQKGIFVEPGTVTYIGNWDVYYGQQFKVNSVSHVNEKTGYRVSYDVGKLFDYAEEHAWLKKYPLRVSHMNGKRIANNWVETES